MTTPEQKARDLLELASSRLDEADVPGARRAIGTAREVLLKMWRDRHAPSVEPFPYTGGTVDASPHLVGSGRRGEAYLPAPTPEDA